MYAAIVWMLVAASIESVRSARMVLRVLRCMVDTLSAARAAL